MTRSQRFGYAVGDFGINLYFMSAMTWLLYFYTDVFGISAGTAGAVFLVARLVDAVTDPIMGVIADRTHTKWGRFRPYILYGAVPLGLIAVATFTVPDLTDSGRVVWAFVTYVSFGVIYTVVTIPYSALTAVMTTDHQERTKLSTLRMGCAFAGGLVVAVGMLRFVEALGGGAIGFQLAMAAFAIIATVLMWVTFATSEERVAAEQSRPVAFADCWRVISGNKPLIVVMLLFTFGMLAFTVRQTVAVYYFKYNLGRPDLIEVFFLLTLCVMFIGLAAVPWLSRRFGKAGGIRVGAVVAMMGGTGLYLTPYDQVEMIMAFGCVMALGGAPIAVLGWAMIPDTVEYAQLRTGVRADGVVYAVTSFFQKLAKAIGGAGVAGLLAAVGYVANTDQTPETLEGILITISLGPVVINIGLYLVSRLYTLDETAHARVLDQLAEKVSS